MYLPHYHIYLRHALTPICITRITCMYGVYTCVVMYYSHTHTDVPGGFKPLLKGHIPLVDDCIWLTRSLDPNKNRKKHCNGRNVHDVCIISVGDLFRLKYRPQNITSQSGPMFHNKYFMEVDHVVMDCCEEELVQRNREEYRTDCEIA